MNDFIAKYGRKFSLSIFGMVLGFMVTVLGFLTAANSPSIAGPVAEIVGTFGMLLSIALGAFSGADAAITWKHGGAPRSVVTSKTETTTQVEGTPPRPSGTVKEPPET